MSKSGDNKANKKRQKEEKKFHSTGDEVLQELFNDLYHDRKKIYKVNFFRGIFFGFGSFLGATMLVAILIWALSLFGNLPVIGDYFNRAQQSIEQGKPQN